MADPAQFRALPSVDELVRGQAGRLPHPTLVQLARRALSAARSQLQAGQPAQPADAFAASVQALVRASLRPVINATGVVLHTNLGRAPLPAFAPLPGYSNLELDLATGKRGRRDNHTAHLLEALLGCPAIVVNNNAAAVFLTLHELAAGREVLVSRGELVEIGDGFRIPDIMARSGAILREVGTTNKTRVVDYADAITDRTALILRVHPSNFRVSGFAGRPAVADLVQLGRARNIPVYEDIGSGCVTDLRRFGLDEPVVQESLAAGMDVVSFSTDKLLGGPQSGILAGRAELIQRLRRNPLFRMLRIDKLQVQSLAETLGLLVQGREAEIPALRMMADPAESIKARAEALAAHLPLAVVVQGESVIGGGSTPDQRLPTWLLVLAVPHAARAHERLRTSDPAILARIERDRLVFDLRTVARNEEGPLLEALRTL